METGQYELADDNPDFRESWNKGLPDVLAKALLGA
jgi:hypothetical protein